MNQQVSQRTFADFGLSLRTGVQLESNQPHKSVKKDQGNNIYQWFSLQKMICNKNHQNIESSKKNCSIKGEKMQEKMKMILQNTEKGRVG